MTTAKSQSVRSFAFMLLVEKEVDRELPFLSYKDVIMVNPKKNKNPFSGEGFDKLTAKINSSFKDTTVIQTAIHILSNLVIYIYPFPIEVSDMEELFTAIEYNAKSYLGYSDLPSLEEMAKAKNLDVDKVKYYFDLLESSLNDL